MSETTQLFNKGATSKGIIFFLKVFFMTGFLARAIFSRFDQPVYHLYYIGDSIMFFTLLWR